MPERTTQRATEAVVRMSRHEGGWRVEIRETTPHRPGSRAFAAVEAYDIDTALRMAGPYLATLSEPDMFEEALIPEHYKATRGAR